MPTVELVDRRPEPQPPLPHDDLVGVAEFVLRAEGRDEAHLSLAVVDDEEIADLHLRFMDVPGATDVISFPLDDEHLPIPLLGEVVASADTAAREAQARQITWREELMRYVVHGTLHLLGYDDLQPDEQARMHARQEDLLERFLARPPRAAETE